MAYASPHLAGSIARTKFPSPYSADHNQKLDPMLLHKFYRGPASKQIHIRPDRSKRGIVLIDEDFNVPPGPGVKQSWSDGDFDSNGVLIVKNATRIFSEGEGSGSSETAGDELITHTKFTRFVTPDNLQLTSVQDRKITTSDDYENLEASGDGDTPISNATETSKDEATPSTHASASTDEPENTSNGVSSTHVAVTTAIPRKVTDDSYEHLCMNFTCDLKDLIISPSLSETVPEGINLTLTCSLANATEQGSLKWYKYNESDHFLLEELSDGHEINHAIPKTILNHSGTYMCFKFTEQSCCHGKLEITVYEMPNYKQHLIIIGSVVAVSLLICIFIAIRKSVKTKKYEDKVKVELQNAEKPFLL